MKAKKVIVTSVAVVTMKFLFGMCDCSVDSDIGTSNYSSVLEILHMCGYAHVRSHMSPCMDCMCSSK